MAIYFSSAEINHNISDLEEARANYLRVLALKPDHIKAYNSLGIVLAEQGKVDDAKAAVEKAAVAGSLTLLAAAPAHASQTDEVVGFLKAFLEFRTKDPTSFLLLTVAPILVPYAIFSVLVGKKEIRRKEELAAGGLDKFMAERGLDIDTLKLPQLNAFAIAAEKDLLDDEMVREFVRQVELSEKWKKSTIDVADPRLENAKRRARAEKILALKEERAKQEASANN